jgi:transposase-like protein
VLDVSYNGSKPGIEVKIIEMTANASGIRDISRVLKISKDKVSNTLKKLKMQ